jgi:hypothetical protein
MEGGRAGTRQRGLHDVVEGARGGEIGVRWGAAESGGASRAPLIVW